MPEQEYDIKKIRSPIPPIASGAFWLLWSLLFPLYLWYHFLIVLLLSVVVFYIAEKLFPPREVKVARPKKLELSGDEEADRMIRAANEHLIAIRKNGERIQLYNAPLAADVAGLTESGEKILSYLAKNPDKAPLVRRFLNYYLPTLHKLSGAYIDFRKHNTSASTAAEIESAIPTMKEVFQKQTDKLFSDYELDISSDITVLESKLAGDGLSGFKSETDR